MQGRQLPVYQADQDLREPQVGGCLLISLAYLVLRPVPQLVGFRCRSRDFMELEIALSGASMSSIVAGSSLWRLAGMYSYRSSPTKCR